MTKKLNVSAKDTTDFVNVCIDGIAAHIADVEGCPIEEAFKSARYALNSCSKFQSEASVVAVIKRYLQAQGITPQANAEGMKSSELNLPPVQTMTTPVRQFSSLAEVFALHGITDEGENTFRRFLNLHKKTENEIAQALFPDSPKDVAWMSFQSGLQGDFAPEKLQLLDKVLTDIEKEADECRFKSFEDVLRTLGWDGKCDGEGWKKFRLSHGLKTMVDIGKNWDPPKSGPQFSGWSSIHIVQGNPVQVGEWDILYNALKAAIDTKLVQVQTVNDNTEKPSLSFKNDKEMWRSIGWKGPYNVKKLKQFLRAHNISFEDISKHTDPLIKPLSVELNLSRMFSTSQPHFTPKTRLKYFYAIKAAIDKKPVKKNKASLFSKFASLFY